MLREAEAGMPVNDICRKHGVSQGSFYVCRTKYSGMSVSDAKRLHELEDENRRLKRLVADQALDISRCPRAQLAPMNPCVAGFTHPPYTIGIQFELSVRILCREYRS